MLNSTLAESFNGLPINEIRSLPAKLKLIKLVIFDHVVMRHFRSCTCLKGYFILLLVHASQTSVSNLTLKV